MRGKHVWFTFKRFGVQIPGWTVVRKGFFQRFSSSSHVNSYKGSACCYSDISSDKHSTLTVSHPQETSLSEGPTHTVDPEKGQLKL
jgi:hypothetical protein